MKSLNNAQKKAVEYIDGALLIVAGAGTGKTTVITEKIAYLVKKGLAKPEEILALTFTDKAAGEMEDRVDLALDTGYTQIQISTFHTFCQRLLEDHGMDIGLPNQFKLLTETDAWLLVRENLEIFKLDYYRPIGNPTRHIHELLKHFSKCKDELVTPEEYLKHAEESFLDKDDVNTDERSRLKEVANAYHIYNHLLLDNNALDFGDLIFYAHTLLGKRPRILKSLQKQFKYILVDEFQDVNLAQYGLTKLITQNSKLITDFPQLTVVGDDDQSIYAFRGASVSNILQFKDDFPKAKEIVLTENYRSGQEILDHAYKLIQKNNPDRLEVKLSINKKLIAGIKNQESGIRHNCFVTLEEEVGFVVAEVLKLKDESDCTWDDFALLVRANAHAVPFMEAMERSGVPFEFLTSTGLHRQDIVVDCFNILRSLVNFYDNLTIYNLLNLPHWKLAEGDLVSFTRNIKKKSVLYYEAIGNAGIFTKSKELIDVCEKLRHLIDAGVNRSRFELPTTLLLEFLQDCGYLGYLAKSEEDGVADALRSIRHLKQFFEFIERYQQTSPKARVFGFINYYEQILASGDLGKLYQPVETPDSVNILTVHSAKGLEFRHTFIVNCVEQRFPTMRRKDAIQIPLELVRQELPEGDYHEQEERRLFYVAMTRAKQSLYLTSSEYYEGAKRAKKVSRFIEECGIHNKDIVAKIVTTDYRLQTTEPLGRAPSADRRSKTVVQYDIPKTFSFSQIRSFQTCKYQYKLAYLLKIPTRQSHYFSFGNTMHLTMQRFYQAVQTMNGSVQSSLFDPSPATLVTKNDPAKVVAPTQKDLQKIFEDNWIGDWYQSKKQREEYYKKGQHTLNVFYKQHDGEWTVPVALEKGFKIKIGEYLVTGKIDRVDSTIDGLHIVDYKTGKSKEKVFGAHKEQLLLYQLATERTPYFRNIGKTNLLTYYYLPDSLETSFLGTEKELNNLEKKIEKTIKELHETDWSNVTRKQGCGRCEYCQAIA